jgi:hypothetical protein
MIIWKMNPSDLNESMVIKRSLNQPQLQRYRVVEERIITGERERPGDKGNLPKLLLIVKKFC